MTLQGTLRKFAKTQRGTVGTPRPATPYQRARGTVTALGAAGACTVKVAGVTVPAHAYATRTRPKVGQAVEVELVGGGRVLVAGTLGEGSTGGGGAGTVTSVASPTGTLAVTTPTTAVKLKVKKLLASLFLGTGVTVSQVGTQVKLAVASVTKVLCGGDLSGTSTNATVAKVPAAALVAGTNVTLTTTAGKAKIAASGGGSATPLTVKTVKLKATGTVDTAAAAVVSAQAVTAGTAFQPTAARDVMLYVSWRNSTHDVIVVTMGPAVTGATFEVQTVHLTNTGTSTVGYAASFCLRVPAGWYVKCTSQGLGSGSGHKVTC